MCYIDIFFFCIILLIKPGAVNYVSLQDIMLVFFSLENIA
jgi:hypothetical protein